MNCWECGRELAESERPKSRYGRCICDACLDEEKHQHRRQRAELAEGATCTECRQPIPQERALEQADAHLFSGYRGTPRFRCAACAQREADLQRELDKLNREGHRYGSHGYWDRT